MIQILNTHYYNNLILTSNIINSMFSIESIIYVIKKIEKKIEFINNV